MSARLENLSYDLERGALMLGPLRYLLLRPETLSEIQKGVEDRLGSSAPDYLYTAGASWAMGVMRRLRSALAGDSHELLQAACRHASELGWGKFELAAWQVDEKKLVVHVTGSPLAAAYGQADQPVCHLFAGAVGGMAEAVLSMPTSCTEDMCIARGDPVCLFSAIGNDVAGSDSWSW